MKKQHNKSILVAALIVFWQFNLFAQNPCLDYIKATQTIIHIDKNQWSVSDQNVFTDKINSNLRSSSSDFGANGFIPVNGVPIPVGFKSDKSLNDQSKEELIQSVSNYFASSDKSTYDFVIPSTASLKDYTDCLTASRTAHNYYVDNSQIKELGDQLLFTIHSSANIKRTKFHIYLSGGKFISPDTSKLYLEGSNSSINVIVKRDNNADLSMIIVSDQPDEIISIFRPTVSQVQMPGKWAVMIGAREYDLADAEQLAVHDNRTIDPRIFLLRTNTVRHDPAPPTNYFRFFIHDPQHQSYQEAQELYDKLYPLYQNDPNKFPQMVNLESYLPKGKTYADYHFDGSTNVIRMCDWHD